MYQKRSLRKQEEEQYVRSKLHLVFVGIFLSVAQSLLATPYFQLDSALRVAQRRNVELRLNNAQDIILNYPDKQNVATSYLLYFNSFIRAFITEEEGNYNRYTEEKSRAIDDFIELDDSSKYKRFLLAEVYLHSAVLKAKKDELYSAAMDLSRVNALVEENHKLFPDFILNNKARGLLKVYLSTVPKNYQWAVKLLGAEGNLSEGLRLLRDLQRFHDTEHDFSGIAKETTYLYSFALFQVAKNPSKAWSATLACTKDYKTNRLSAFFRANMALKLNKSGTALRTLQSTKESEEYFPFYHLDYLKGLASLNQFDRQAINYFRNFLENFGGKSFKRSCLQKMSWYHVIQEEKILASKYQKQILDVPNSLMEVDKQATEYAHKQLPHPELLKSRLYYDNGKYDEANVILSDIDYKSFDSKNYTIEYSYRFGRVSEKLGNYEAAIKYYEACTLLAKESEEYYGAYASIYLGDYYLKAENLSFAEKFYKRALTFHKNKEFTNSIEQRAKQGIKKVNQKTK